MINASDTIFIIQNLSEIANLGEPEIDYYIQSWALPMGCRLIIREDEFENLRDELEFECDLKGYRTLLGEDLIKDIGISVSHGGWADLCFDYIRAETLAEKMECLRRPYEPDEDELWFDDFPEDDGL